MVRSLGLKKCGRCSCEIDLGGVIYESVGVVRMLNFPRIECINREDWGV